MPALTNLERDKLSNLAEEGNEDAVFFLGKARRWQTQNYYRGWKILADEGDDDALQRLNEERERLKANEQKKVERLEKGVCDGDSEVIAERDKIKESVRKRQQACRARRNANQPTTTRKRKAADMESDYVSDPVDGAPADECNVDDEEPPPVAAKPPEIKQEAENDVIELRACKVAPWLRRKGLATRTRATQEDEIELKLTKINAEIRQADLEAKRATLELERLHLKRPRRT
jgi:hypothetical protein